MNAAAGELTASPSQKVIGTLLDWIDSGKIRPGCLVPSARKLSADLKVDKGTVMRAFEQLVRQGRLVQTPTRRHQVPETPRAAAAPNHPWLDKTVLLFTRAVIGDQSVQSKRRPGWSWFLETGVHEALLESGRHALVVNPDSVDGADGIGLAGGADTDAAGTPSGLPPFGAIVTQASRDGQALRPLLNMLAALRDAGRPVIAYGDNPELARYDRIIPDHRAGVRELTRRLFAMGAKRPRLLESRGIENWYWVRNRRAGFADAYRERGLEPPPVAVMEDEEALPSANLTAREALEYRATLMAGGLAPLFLENEPPDALLCVTDGHVFGMAMACRRLGREPGRDVLIAGYDNYWQDCPEMAIAPFAPVLTADKRNRAVGHALVRLFLDRLEGRLPEEARIDRVAPEILTPGA